MTAGPLHLPRYRRHFSRVGRLSGNLAHHALLKLARRSGADVVIDLCDPERGGLPPHRHIRLGDDHLFLLRSGGILIGAGHGHVVQIDPVILNMKEPISKAADHEALREEIAHWRIDLAQWQSRNPGAVAPALTLPASGASAPSIRSRLESVLQDAADVAAARVCRMEGISGVSLAMRPPVPRQDGKVPEPEISMILSLSGAQMKVPASADRAALEAIARKVFDAAWTTEFSDHLHPEIAWIGAAPIPSNGRLWPLMMHLSSQDRNGSHRKLQLKAKWPELYAG